MNRTRPYPLNNQQKVRRGAICLICNKKFLYRDAMNEYAIKLQMKAGNFNIQQEELEKEEENYNKLMTTLADLK